MENKITICEIDLEKRSEFSETSNTIQNKKFKGVTNKILINKTLIVSYSINLQEDSQLITKYKTPLFKLHFDLNQGTEYSLFKNDSETISINKGNYVLLYTHPKDNQFVKKTNQKKAIEFFFTEDSLDILTENEYRFLLKKIRKNSTPVIQNITKAIYSIIHEITSCEYIGCTRKAFLDLKTKELLLVSLANYTISFNSAKTLDCDLDCLSKVEAYIKANLEKELTIPELSSIFAVNTDKLKKTFKRTYGTTIFKYITRIRMEKATELIKNKNYTIAQASYNVGYKNPQHFTVAFKKHNGYLPRHLKK